METDASVPVGAWCAVFEVPFYRASHTGKLAADLVVAACEQLHFQQVVTVAVAHKPIAQACQLGIRPFPGDIGLVLLLIPHHPVLQFSLRDSGSIAAQGPIGFVYIAVPEHSCKPFQSLGSLGKYDNSAHRPVQTVRYPHKHLPRFVIPVCNESF